jgi:hypothetical protein
MYSVTLSVALETPKKGHPDPTRPKRTKHEHLSRHDGHRSTVNINALNVALCPMEVIRGMWARCEPHSRSAR